MRNIFLFIRRYFNFLFFLLVQGIALYSLFTYNKFQEAAFMGVATETTGWFYKKYDGVESYFNLKESNAELARQNELLQNQLGSNFYKLDSSGKKIIDTVAKDSTGTQVREYIWREAKVVGNTVGLQNNYITIQRGEKQGVKKDMGVVSPSGVVGVVISASDNYAVVMSLLHRQSRVSAKIKKSGDLGIVQWDGENPMYVNMINVPKSVKLVKGDTIVTSQYSYLFPANLMIGTVDQIVEDNSSNFYVMKVKPAADFFKLEYVSVVENLQKEERKKLEEAAKKIQQ
ncbi:MULTISPECIES: rod shape-determining protein MreC [unclassified Paraflavitalea]|uniref:rod shape-determining protein MreC n=1 Tax=unclassified Paraflavitalea TaxID=2798305 RepID=UPI003D33A4DB